MTYAIGKNLVTCASPGSSYRDNFTGNTMHIPGCSQPGTEKIIHEGDVVLEYCGRHAVEFWREEDE